MASNSPEITVTTTPEVRSALARWAERQSTWRSEMAARFPDDHRNAESAAALLELAEWVNDLPSDDPLLLVASSPTVFAGTAFAGTTWRLPDGAYFGGVNAQSGRFCWGRADDPRAWLTALIAAAEAAWASEQLGGEA